MWAELFCLNSEFLTAELDRLTDRLALFRDAVARMDEEEICALMREGKARYQDFFRGNRGYSFKYASNPFTNSLFCTIIDSK